MTVRKRQTVKDYVDKLLSSKTASVAGVVRRKRSNVPPYINISALIAEVTSRSYKLLIGQDQFFIVTDRTLMICN